MAMRFQLSLRMFLLLCAGAGFLAAWAGLAWQNREGVQRYEIRYEWREFGKAGKILVDDRLKVTGASVRCRTDLEELIARPGVPMTITYLSIYGSEAYRAFRPEDFPNVKKLSLCNVQLQQDSMVRLGELHPANEIGAVLAVTAETNRAAHVAFH